jgi:hypothetical protein
MSGNWTLTVDRQTTCEFCADSHLVEVAIRSELTLDVFLGLAADERIAGRPIPIRVSLSDTLPVLGATVEVWITDPNDRLWFVGLFDDGLHGDGQAADGFYGNVFSGTFAAGSYVAVVTAEGTSNLGDDFQRRLRTSFHMNITTDTDRDGMPNWWEEQWGTNPQSPDAQGDPDDDGCVNIVEYIRSTDPLDPDTDDGGENDCSDSDPLDPRDDRIPQPRARAWPGVGWNAVRYTVAPEYHSVQILRAVNQGRFSPVAGGLEPTGEWIDTDVLNDQEYCYRVVAVRAGVIVSAPSGITCATPKRDPIPPTGWVLINKGAVQTSNIDAELTLYATDNALEAESEHPGAPPRPMGEALVSGVTDMMISNDGGFDGAAWEPYRTLAPWRLEPEHGLATVYVKYRDDAENVSEVFHSTIRFICIGDLDGDGDTDLGDLGILLADFGCAAPGPCVGDLDGDGDTDLDDLAILLANFACGTL